MHAVEQEQLTEVLGRVLESMAFIVPGPNVDRDETKTDKTMWACAVIRFTGEFDGKVMLTVPANMLPGLLRDMLGEDNSLYSSKHMCDALGELANVMCGNLLLEIVGTKPVFDLERAEVCLNDRPEALLREDTVLGTARVELSAGCAELTVTCDAIP